MDKKFTINLNDSVYTKEQAPLKSSFRSSTRSPDDDHPADKIKAQFTRPPLSYAEFVIQQKNRVTHPSSSGMEGLDEGHGTAAPVLQQPGCGAAGTVRLERQHSRADDVDGVSCVQEQECQKSDMGLSSGQKAPGCGSSIVVSPRQRGNPILKFVRNVPWEFGDVVPDYVLGQTTCALFLSLRYHNLNPSYIHERLKCLGQSFVLRLLLVQVDVKDPHHALKELARICIMADCTLILAWSPEEAGRYLETYKVYEKKPVDLLKGQVERDFLSKATDCLTTVKSVNRSDVLTLLSAFSSLEGVINASKEDLALCPGLGPQKARRLYDIMHQPFVKARRKGDVEV